MQLLVRVQRVDCDCAGVGELVQLQVLSRVDHHALLQLASQSEASIAAVQPIRGQYYLVQQVGGPQLPLGRPPPAQRVSDIARVEGL